ncbi:methyltransferase domain-containing protein [Gordonibacter sp. RACS_AR49]|uniref:methyltransferase domain-containing protein n=1 Tax=Gordonibacter sp. RACS_AR49 TaxID=2871986 RepID=UPI00261AEA73|nr:methyltransferase domain-containing protein [Gordonibacter sp. RACS_AR49]MDN4508959.1 methyltransferase domain-containing protein [Gordonibacter sp. RACS_AR49]
MSGNEGKAADSRKAGRTAREGIARHYADVARAAAGAAGATSTAAPSAPCCCEPAAAGEAFSLYAREVLAGLPARALAASRGCGDPVARANLQAGERVLDLGSGGGIDALIAARLVGAHGHVWGLDMTPDMVKLARRNAADAGIANVDFLEGGIERAPLPDASMDVVISNCVINLCQDKAAALAEARRVLAPGGRLVVSDIVALRPVPAGAYDDLCTLTGCVNGISSTDAYERMLRACGFDRVAIEPKTVYTTEVLEEKAMRKGREAAFRRVAAQGGGGTCGSAIVFARVEEERC